MPVILPTHTCFDDALEYLALRVAQDPRLAHGSSLQLVHGIALIPVGQADAGEPFAHAWVEEAGYCWTAGLLNGARILVKRERAEFYRALRVQQTTAYSVRRAWQENKRSETFGPWRAEYLALCRQSVRADAQSTDVDAAGSPSTKGVRDGQAR
jgi:hypothetical protein